VQTARLKKYFAGVPLLSNAEVSTPTITIAVACYCANHGIHHIASGLHLTTLMPFDKVPTAYINSDNGYTFVGKGLTIILYRFQIIGRMLPSS